MNTTEVQFCGCVGVAAIQGPGPTFGGKKPLCTNIPYTTRNAGAEFQDKKLGIGNRIHNKGPKNITCTVCGRTTKHGK